MNITGTKGETAQVSNDQVHAYAAIDSRIADVSKREELAFSWTMTSYDYDAADTILTVCNDDAAKNLHITKIILGADASTVAVIHQPAYATWAGTAVTGANLNRTSTGVAVATAKADETGQATQGTIVGTVMLLANQSQTIEFDGALILGYHDAVGVDLVTTGTGCQCSIWGYYE